MLGPLGAVHAQKPLAHLRIADAFESTLAASMRRRAGANTSGGEGLYQAAGDLGQRR